MKKYLSALFCAGCTLFPESNDGMIGDDDGGDEVGVGLFDEVYCETVNAGGCVTSHPAVAIDNFDEGVKSSVFEKITGQAQVGSCSSSVTTYPCAIDLTPVLEIDPLYGGELNLNAFPFHCSMCPEMKTHAAGWIQEQDVSPHLIPWCRLDYSFGPGIPSDGVLRPVENNLNLVCESGCENCEDDPPWVKTTSPRGFATLGLTKKPIGLCETDSDCAFLNGGWDDGEGQCVSWPFHRYWNNTSLSWIDVPRGCFQVTDKNQGVIPPLPSVGEMMVEPNLYCEDNLCVTNEFFVESVIRNPVAATVGSEWVVHRDVVELTRVEPYSLAAIVGLQKGDQILGVEDDQGRFVPLSTLNGLSIAYASFEEGTAVFSILRGSRAFEIEIDHG